MMTKSMSGIPAAAVLLMAMASAPAAAELPAPVRAMLEAAISGGNDAEIATVAKYARTASPDDKKEIDDMVAAHRKAVAEANQAKLRSANLFQNWHITGELGGFATTGNSETSGLTAGLTLTRQGISWRHKIHAYLDYQRASGVTTQRQWLASYEPNYTLNAGLYTYGLIEYEQDRFQGFDDRITLSGGMGYRAINSRQATLDIKGGPAWRRTSWIATQNADEISGLLGADLVWHIARRVDFTDSGQALWDSDNNTYTNTAALSFKVSPALSSRLSYSFQHETNPAAGTKKTDTTARATLVFGF